MFWIVWDVDFRVYGVGLECLGVLERVKRAQDKLEDNPHVNMDEQRDIMKQYENAFPNNDDYDGASPSSDFGF